MRAQEVPDPDFSNMSKRTLAYMKYLPFPTEQLAAVTRVLLTTAHDAQWHTRAATINYIQVRSLQTAYSSYCIYVNVYISSYDSITWLVLVWNGCEVPALTSPQTSWPR